MTSTVSITSFIFVLFFYLPLTLVYPYRPLQCTHIITLMLNITGLVQLILMRLSSFTLFYTASPHQQESPTGSHLWKNSSSPWLSTLFFILCSCLFLGEVTNTAVLFGQVMYNSHFFSVYLMSLENDSIASCLAMRPGHL